MVYGVLWWILRWFMVFYGEFSDGLWCFMVDFEVVYGVLWWILRWFMAGF